MGIVDLTFLENMIKNGLVYNINTLCPTIKENLNILKNMNQLKVSLQIVIIHIGKTNLMSKKPSLIRY